MKQTSRITAALLGLILASSLAPRAQARPDDLEDRKITLDNGLSQRALDRLLFDTLRDVINKGADMYNNGDHSGCYRLFEGALITARPLLAHRPDLQKAVATALSAADRDPVMYRRAFPLRAALDKVRTGVNPNPKKDEKLPLPKIDEQRDEKLPLPKPADKKDQKQDEKKADPEKSPDPDKKQDKPNPDPDQKKEDTLPEPKKEGDKKDDKEKLKDSQKNPDDTAH